MSATSLKLLLRDPIRFVWRYALGWKQPDGARIPTREARVELHPEKTRIVHVTDGPVNFPPYSPRVKRTFSFTGMVTSGGCIGTSPRSNSCANRPSPHGICEPPLKHYAMQIVFDIGIQICHHIFVPVGINLKEKDIL